MIYSDRQSLPQDFGQGWVDGLGGCGERGEVGGGGDEGSG